MLEIKTLGNLVITEDGKILDALGSLRSQVLLTYLALETGSHRRHYLANMLWPESSEDKALTSLRVVLSELRKGVGDYLDISRTDIAIHPDSQISLDVRELERSVVLGKTESALNIYRGDFLTGIYIPGSTEYENWRRWEDERIRILLTTHLEERIRNRISLSRYQEVEGLSQNLLKIDPFNETANQCYALTLAMSGHRSAAIKHILAYSKLLLDDLGIEASPEIIDLKDKISNDDLDSLAVEYKPKNNLPLHQTNFIGRRDGLARLTEQIIDPQCRLISIIGPGGIGKTRLAIQSIVENIHHFPDGAFYIPLESTSDSEGIFQAIAAEMNFKFDSIISLISAQTQLLDVIRNLKIVLLLDGFEHLTKSGNQISFLLNNAPNLEIIVTSRHKLNIPGEWSFTLEGMKTKEPSGEHDGNPPEAAELFLHRSEQIYPNQRIESDDLFAVLRICELVEGLPLGIELAAGWTSVLGFSEIVDEITKTYEFLDRQTDKENTLKNIRAVFTSSWNLLDQPLQDILPRLSVFNGGFTHQAAKEIAQATLTDLSTLVDKSMLRKTQGGKFSLHPVVKEFSREILLERPREYQKILHNHYQYYAAYFSSRIPEMYLLSENSTHLDLKNESLNIQAATEYALINQTNIQDQEIIKHLFSYYIIHGWYEGGLAFQRLVDIIEEILPDDREKYQLLYAKILAQQGFFFSNLGLLQESEIICQKALPILEEANESRELAICVHNLGINAIFRGEYDLAFEQLDKAIQISQHSSCSSFPSFYLWVGYVHFLLGNYEEGIENFFLSLDLFEQDQNDRGTAFSLSKIGLAYDAVGNYQNAITYHQKSLEIFQESDNQAGQGYALSRMSLGALLLQDYQSALQFGEQALVEFSKIGHRWGRCASLTRIAYAKLGLGKTIDAKHTFLDALAIAHEHQLDPLCLHALAGIACLKTTLGDKINGQAIMDYVQRHPKTPEIYLSLNRFWFKLDGEQKAAPRNQISDPELTEIARTILQQDSNRPAGEE
jgi:predicted ATPase/DNA-binding SARP family transcriptional activator/tetratricopeptide (TPR) repeat protein